MSTVQLRFFTFVCLADRVCKLEWMFGIVILLDLLPIHVKRCENGVLKELHMTTVWYELVTGLQISEVQIANAIIFSHG
jgi:hypothetical protein